MKSHVSALTELAVCIYIDAAAKCTANTNQARDLSTLRSRIEHEGLSFLTITLPSIGKDLERALSIGGIEPTLFRSFRKSGKAPAFLRGFFAQVFDVGTGRTLDEPSIEAIEGIRQIAYSFKKLQVPCSPKRTAKALAEFISCECELQVPLASDDIQYFTECSRAIWSHVFANEGLSLADMIPRHGPGATEEKVSGNQKFIFRRWHDRLEPYFPLFHNAFPNENAYESKEFERVQIVSEEDEHPVRVITVPKTLKAPRVIAIEPVCMQYIQQAISKSLTKRLQSHPLTRGHLNFSDQSVNGKLAMTSSKTGEFATLDLSAASDRVPLDLALSMFDSVPDVQGAIEACRSKRAQLPSGEVIHLKKFAPMGSALCFPVESMYFYTICIGALLRKHDLPVTLSNIRKVARRVYIYGDDIIIPAGDAVVVIDHLQKYYCKVGTSKSFWTGKFRESCGVDAYDGEVVTPTYVRHLPPVDQREASALLSWVSSSNLFYRRGYWKTSSHMLKLCETYLGPLPIVGGECAGVGKVSFQPIVSIKRWNRKYQVPEVRTWVATPIYRTDRLEGYPALLKSLLSLESRQSDEPLTEKEHLRRTARYGAVTLKRRWVKPY